MQQQRKKNIRLLATLVFLIGLTILVFLMDRNTDRIGVDQGLFAIRDTSAINRIVMSGDTFSNVLEKSNGGWLVNDQYTLDEGLRQVLLSVLQNVQVRRPVSMAEKETVVDFLREEGIKVEIYGEGQILKAFLSGGDQKNNLTYFMRADKEEPYVVHLPGYESYVAGLFEIKKNDWRNRIVLSSNWQAVQELALRYPGNERQGFSMIASERLFEIPGLQNPDTTKMMDYFQHVEYVLADKYIDHGESQVYDSLAKTVPYATLSVRELGDERPEIVDFYSPIPGDRFILGKTGENQLVLFDYERISGLFKTLDDFRKEGQ